MYVLISQTMPSRLTRDKELVLDAASVELLQVEMKITFSLRIFHPLFCKHQVCSDIQMATRKRNVFVTWFPVSWWALNKWQMLLSLQGQQRTHWIINQELFWVRREKQLNLFATSCINLQPSCWSAVQSIAVSRGWLVHSCIELWVDLAWPCVFRRLFFFLPLDLP